MSKAGSASKIKVTSFNDLFGNTDTISESQLSNDVREIPLTELYEFKNHPFHADADKLEEMAGSRMLYAHSRFNIVKDYVDYLAE